MSKYVLFLVVLSLSAIASAQPLTYPQTRKVDHVDHYFGTPVADPYRWLENTDSADVADWVKAQNQVTFDYLSRIPFRDKIKARLEKMWNYPKYSQPFKVGNKYFFHKNDGLQNQSVLYVQEGLNGSPKVFLDPNTLASDGTVAVGSIVPSHDDKYLAYDISRSGSDWKEIRVMDVSTGEQLADHIEWVKFSNIAWHGDGFYYSRYDEPKEGKYSNRSEYHKVFYHKLGTLQSADVLIYQDTANPTRLHYVGTTQDEKFLTMYISQGDQKGNLLYVKDLRKPGSPFVAVRSEFGNQHYVIESHEGKLFLYTNLDAPRGRIVSLDPASMSNWQTIVPQKAEVLEGSSIVGGKLFAVYMKDANHKAIVFNTDGSVYDEVELPALGSVNGFDGNIKDDATFFSFTSFTYPTSIYRYDIKSRKSSLFRKSDADVKMDDYVTKQVFVRSKDGTKVPMFIVHKKGLKLDGTAPTYLYAYGGFNNSLTPYFSISRMIVLENGGVYAVANLRGGGEYGEDWHEAGMGLKKQNVFDDFIACAEYLIGEKYTSNKRLAIAGGSNGGLLVGAVANQRPELFGVALPAVGVMDMLRYHKFTIGWGWAKEYGTSEDSTHFTNLIKYSPLHTVRKGVTYPATLITTADHDDRVVPAHSFKYAAALQEAAYNNPNPLLIRIDVKAGHGAGKPTTKVIDEITDAYSFMFYNMGFTPKY